jgi:hypothetical protein
MSNRTKPTNDELEELARIAQALIDASQDCSQKPTELNAMIKTLRLCVDGGIRSWSSELDKIYKDRDMAKRRQRLFALAARLNMRLEAHKSMS